MSTFGSPARNTVLLRPRAPVLMVMPPFAIFHSLASSAISAAFALAFSGGAVTETLNASLPSALARMSPIRLIEALGVKRTATETPPGLDVKGGVLCSGLTGRRRHTLAGEGAGSKE